MASSPGAGFTRDEHGNRGHGRESSRLRIPWSLPGHGGGAEANSEWDFQGGTTGLVGRPRGFVVFDDSVN